MGHVISAEGLKPDPSKVEAILGIRHLLTSKEFAESWEW